MCEVVLPPTVGVQGFFKILVKFDFACLLAGEESWRRWGTCRSSSRTPRSLGQSVGGHSLQAAKVAEARELVSCLLLLV